MSICKEGSKEKYLVSKKIVIEVSPNHSLLRLMNSLDWEKLIEIIMEDLKKTTSKLKWWLGRKLNLRIHLGVYLLQQLLNETDRGIERQIYDNAVYAVFCGYTLVKAWHVPDHSKIEAFRSRLSPKTQCALNNEIVKLATAKGFANPEHVDIDSTVQVPDMQNPATVNLLVKAALLGRRLQKLIKDKIPNLIKGHFPEIDMKIIKGLAKQHYFEKRKAFKEKIQARKEALSILWKEVSQVLQPVIRFGRMLTEPFILGSLLKKERNLLTNFIQKVPTLLTELFEHCYEDAPRRSKVFSFHRDAVECFNKNKHYRGLEFGRQFQIGRVGGNFVYTISNTSIRMPDAANFKAMLTKHIELFQTPITSIATDKGYYSKENEQLALDFGIKAVAVQRPGRRLRAPPNNLITQEQLEELKNRRAGIEPIISHLKNHWQLGRARMKSDNTTESSGYCAMLGFNLKQMIRYLTTKAVPTS